MSNFTGHIPGPWYADDNEVYKDYGDERELIATANIKWEECMFNAELIAAAPDLLAERDRLREALQLLERCVRKMTVVYHDLEPDAPHEECWQEAIDAQAYLDSLQGADHE